MLRSEHFEQYLGVYVNKSKIGQYRKGNEVLVARDSTSACPHQWMQSYVVLTSTYMHQQKFCFKPGFRWIFKFVCYFERIKKIVFTLKFH